MIDGVFVVVSKGTGTAYTSVLNFLEDRNQLVINFMFGALSTRLFLSREKMSENAVEKTTILRKKVTMLRRFVNY